MNTHSTSNWFALVLLLGIMALALGAGRVVHNKQSREAAQQRTEERVTQWHAQIATELPPGQQDAWRRTSQQTPFLLLQACATELPLERRP